MYEILEEIIRDHPVLLNRAPTLHRLGIQAFEPVLVEGKAIRIHPLVCAAFNADFDGDQMAVHVPLSFEAQLEARLLMLSSNNILKPSDGRPVAEPSQDIVLGCYFATKAPADFDTVDARRLRRFVERSPRSRWSWRRQPPDAAQRASCTSWTTIDGNRWEKTTAGRVLFNAIVPTELGYKNHDMKKKALSELVFESYRKAGLAATVQFLDRLKEFGFANATRGGVSIGIEDLRNPDREGRRCSRKPRSASSGSSARTRPATSRTASATTKSSTPGRTRTPTSPTRWSRRCASRKQGFNPVFMMFDSGSRGIRDQIRQLAGMRGLMAKPQKKLTGGIGEIIESPIKSNFREGLSPLEYFTRRTAPVRVWPTRRSRRPTPVTSRAVSWTSRRT